MTIMYHDGNRRLQDQFDSRRISDRLEEKLTRTAFTPDDKAFIESVIYFFLSTADDAGRPDCSFKGGPPGFVRVTAEGELAFPDYDGNGMFKSLGNLLVNAECRAAVHRPARAPAPASRQRHRDGVARRSAARRDGRRTTDRAGAGACDLSQLPALYPETAARRAVGLRAATGPRSGRAGLEGLRPVQGLCASAPADGALTKSSRAPVSLRVHHNLVRGTHRALKIY